MQLEVRVVRAHVWHCCMTPLVDGFLVLVRAGGSTAAVAHAWPEEQPPSPSPLPVPVPMGRKKRWATLVIKCEDIRHDSARAARTIVFAVGDQQQPPPVEMVLFALVPAPQDSGRRHASIKYMATGVLQMSGNDLDAIRGAQEVVFTAPLEKDLGSVEVVLRRVDLIAEAKGQEENQEDQRGSFSVHWTSSEALEKDLQAKERARQEAEAKLLVRLASIETKAMQRRQLQDTAVELMRRQWGAKAIQREFRRVRHKKEETRRRQRKQEEAAKRAKKDAVRSKVVARNQLRKNQLILEWTTQQQQQQRRIEEEGDEEERDAAMETWIQQREEAARNQLAVTRARLQAERDRKLEELAGRKRVTFNSNSSSTRGSREGNHVIIHDGLIHAIQRLHLRK